VVDVCTYFVAIIINLVSCETKIKIPESFIETQMSHNLNNELHHSKFRFSVKNNNGKLIIEDGSRKIRSELKIENGTLIGFDGGEWGGRLIYKPFDNRKKEITVIEKGNIKHLYQLDNKIYFIVGIAHLGLSKGAIFELQIKNNKFTYKKVIELDDAPEIFDIYKNKLYIASQNSFYVIEKLEKRIIFKNTLWNNLYPNSIAIFDERNIFLGIRSGIVKLNLIEPKIQYYKYIKK